MEFEESYGRNSAPGASTRPNQKLMHQKTVVKKRVISFCYIPNVEKQCNTLDDVRNITYNLSLISF